MDFCSAPGWALRLLRMYTTLDKLRKFNVQLSNLSQLCPRAVEKAARKPAVINIFNRVFNIAFWNLYTLCNSAPWNLSKKSQFYPEYTSSLPVSYKPASEKCCIGETGEYFFHCGVENSVENVESWQLWPLFSHFSVVSLPQKQRAGQLPRPYYPLKGSFVPAAV